ncbi:MAG: hypothetical protein ACYCO0_03945 [Candidatus Micrarchaeaceae archaeon]
MDIDLKNSDFWKELKIKPAGNLIRNLEEFYKIYQKTLRDQYGYPKNKDESLSKLYKQVKTDKDFLFAVFLDSLEKSISSSQLSRIRNEDFDLEELPRYSRLLTRRLNKLDNSTGTSRTYYKPNSYPNPFYRNSDKKIWFILKKKTGRATKQGKKKALYDRYPEYVIIITKKDSYWTLRSSFKNMSEKRVLKSIFKSKKPILVKESSIKAIFKDLIDKSRIFEVHGSFSKDEREFGYILNSEEQKSKLNDVLTDDFDFIFNKEPNIEKIKEVEFASGNNIIRLKLIPHKFYVTHIKLVTTGLTPNYIWNYSEELKKLCGVEDDTYIIRPEGKLLRMQYILTSNKINETNLFILKNELEYLISLGFITPYYKNAFKMCNNNECFNCQDKNIFPYNSKICDNCGEKLYKFGAMVTLKRNSNKMSKYVVNLLKDNGLKYKGVIEKSFNNIKIRLSKFIYDDKELLVYFYSRGNLNKLASRFTVRNLPVIVITEKQDIAKDSELSNYIIEKRVFVDIFLEYEKDRKIELSQTLNGIEAKKIKWRQSNFVASTSLFRNFIKSFNLDLLEGKSIQRKGSTFERHITNVLKMLSNAWIELGQTHQNKSVADGLGYLKFKDKQFIYGFDAKLKINSKRKSGLTTKEIKNQTKYINDFKRNARGYGGLKSWLIVVKSQDDYGKFIKSIDKLKNESKFDNIKLLAVEPLLRICEIYEKSLGSEVTNKEAFSEFMYKLVKYKGNITTAKIKKVLEHVPGTERLVTELS